MNNRIVTYSLLVTIILGLSGYCWHTLEAKVTANEKRIEEKVNNETLKQAIDNLKEQQKVQNKQNKERQEAVDKHLDRLYNELLKGK